MKRIVLLLLVAIGLTATSLAITQDATVFADAKSEICSGIGAASGAQGCADPEGGPTINGLIASIVNILSMIVSIVAVIMIIFAGYQYVSSGGDSGKISNAKNTLIYAVVGLVVVALSQALVRFVLQKL